MSNYGIAGMMKRQKQLFKDRTNNHNNIMLLDSKTHNNIIGSGAANNVNLLNKQVNFD